jgi:hypothetical protein
MIRIEKNRSVLLRSQRYSQSTVQIFISRLLGAGKKKSGIEID